MSYRHDIRAVLLTPPRAVLGTTTAAFLAGAVLGTTSAALFLLLLVGGSAW